MSTLLNDLKYAFRRLYKRPGFAVIAVVTLAIGIGANASIFSLINGVLFRPFPGERSGELLRLYSGSKQDAGAYRMFSYPYFCHLRDNNTAFAGLSAFVWTGVGVKEGELYRRVSAAYVSSDIFDTLGVRLARGRSFDAAEERPGCAIPVAIVGHRLWQRLGADPELVGKTIMAHNRPLTVVGILPSSFVSASSFANYDVWLPLGMVGALNADSSQEETPRLSQHEYRKLFLVGQLQPGKNRDLIQPELDSLARALGEVHAQAYQDCTLVAAPMDAIHVNSRPDRDLPVALPLAALMAVSGMILVIACVNLANMFLARGVERQQEMAVCHALGCSRARILQQLLVEGLVISLLGGTVGLLLATHAGSLLGGALNRVSGGAVIVPMTVDWRLLTVTLGLCVSSALVFSLGPAWRLLQTNTMTDMRVSMGSTGRGVRLSRSVLMVGQIALTFVLICVAGLFVTSAWKAARTNPGFSLEQGLLAELDLRYAGYNQEQGQASYRRILARMRDMPGIQAASLGTVVPFGDPYMESSYQRIDGDTGHRAMPARVNSIGADYFRALDMPLLRGREFTLQEEGFSGSTPVVIIDEVLAQALWPHENPIGQYLMEGNDRENAMQVIGVVPHIRDTIIEAQAHAHVYVPFGRHYNSCMYVHLRLDDMHTTSSAMIPIVRQALQSIDPGLPVLGVRTWHQHIGHFSSQSWAMRLGASLFAVLGIVALILAWVGIFGVRSYQVAQGTREIGIRMALGATEKTVLWHILRQSMGVTVTGLGVGLLLTWGCTRFIRSLLFEVQTTEPIVLLAAMSILITAIMLASLLPARRAAKVDPMEALRYE